jgi:hypothetical protein
MILQNGEYFGIVRQLPDPNDSATYYVRAEIRDAATDELLERVTLTDRGSRRFSYPWLVNSKKESAYISVMTAVYTDAAFTTPSDMYSQEIQTFLVETRASHFGGGGSGVDYKKIMQIVLEALRMELPEDLFGKAEMDRVVDRLFQKIQRESEKVGTTVNEHTTKQVKTIDVKPAVTVSAPDVDMRPITAEMRRISKESEQRYAEAVKPIKTALDRVDAAVRAFVDNASTGNDGEKLTLGAIEELKKSLTELQGLHGDFFGGIDDIRAMIEAGADAHAGAIKGAKGSRVRPQPETPAAPERTPADLIKELRAGTQ